MICSDQGRRAELSRAEEKDGGRWVPRKMERFLLVCLLHNSAVFFCLVAFFVFVSKIAWVDLVRDEGRRRERRILETFFSFLCDRTSKWYCSFKLFDRQTVRSFLSFF